MALPADVRAALAGSLLESLDQTTDEDCERAWAAEIARRMDDVASGRLEFVPWDEVRRQLWAR